MPCLKCGAEIIDGQRFCRICGVPVEPDAAAAPQTSVITSDSENLSPVGKTARPTKINTQSVGEVSGAQTNLLEPQGGSETRAIESGHLSVSPAPPVPGSEDQPGQTNPALDQAIKQSTNPALPTPNETPGAQTTPSLNEVLSVSPPGQPGLGGLVAPTTPQLSTYDTTPPLPAAVVPPPQNSRAWMLAIGGIALFGLIFLTFLLIGRSSRIAKPVPTVPSRPATSDISGETYLSEAGASVDVGETVITQKFPLGTAKFTLSNVSGNVTIEGIDGMDALVKVIKTGGSIEERQAIKIIYSTLGGNLSLKTPQLLGSNVDIAYEVQLPRRLSQVNVQAVSSKVKVSNIDALVNVKTTSGIVELTGLQGALRAETESGEVMITQSSGDFGIIASKSRVELQGVNGTVDVKNTAGDTKASFDSSTLADSVKFESVSGNIDVKFRTVLNAELDASTTSGTLDVQGLGVEVQKSPGSSQAIGRIGAGGLPLKIKTVTGNIKVKKV